METCNRLIGGLWLSRRGAKVYFEIRCNLAKGHHFGNCAHVDQEGGTVITSSGVPGTRIVNERGWVSELVD